VKGEKKQCIYIEDLKEVLRINTHTTQKWNSAEAALTLE